MKVGRLYFDPELLRRKKRNPIKEKWLRKWDQLGLYEKVLKKKLDSKQATAFFKKK